MMKTRFKRLLSRVALPMLGVVAMSILPTTAHGQDAKKPAPLKGSGPVKPAIDVPKIAFTQFVLANGLKVILHEDHSSPIVSMELWYHVGSKNDTPGKSGLAHMFEHMMDEGTLRMPSGEYRRIVQEAGGTYSAGTREDWTRYYATVPSNQLETLLWLESERMGYFMGPTLDSIRFNLERESVRNEYRQSMSGAVNRGAEALFATAFATSSYSLPLFGHMSELGSSTVDDLRAFHAKYYVPNNAVLAIAGDFQTAAARKQVERYFSGIVRGAPVKQPLAVTPLDRESRIAMEDPGGQRQLWIAWHGVPAAHSDRVALMALSGVLNARLGRLLINERRVASFMNPGLNAHFDLEAGGLFQTVAVVSGSMTEVERLIDSVVTSVQSDGVTPPELRRWMAAFRTTSLTALQGVSSKAMRLADGATIQGNPGAVFAEVERAQKLTPAEVQRVARKYLIANRIVMSIVPAGKLDQVSKPNEPYVNVTRK